MNLPENAHVAVVDGENFVLFTNHGKGMDPKLGDARNPKTEASNFSAGIRAQDDASQRSGKTDLNELAHGAGVTEWLNGQVLDNKIEKLLVIADPTTLGEMRKHYHGELEKRLVGEIAKTMTNADTGAIEKAIAAE